MEAYEERQQRAAETKEARQSYATNLLLDALNASDHDFVMDLLHSAHKVLGSSSTEAEFDGLPGTNGAPSLRAQVREHYKNLKAACQRCQARAAAELARQQGTYPVCDKHGVSCRFCAGLDVPTLKIPCTGVE